MLIILEKYCFHFFLATNVHLVLQHFRFFSEVTSVCSSEEASAVPVGERVSLVASAPRYGLLFVGQGGVLQGE